MRSNILTFLVRTQKATAALLATATALASATFIPAPYSTYIGIAVVVLSWVVTYFVPYVAKAVEEFVPPPLEGDVIEALTDEFAAVTEDTNGIPVVEHETPQGEWVAPFTGAIRAEDVLARMEQESRSTV